MKKFFTGRDFINALTEAGGYGGQLRRRYLLRFLFISGLVCFSILFLHRNVSFAEAPDPMRADSSWEFSVDLSAYFFPDDFFLLPLAAANHGHLHLEARYNYEDLETGSVFGGYNLSFGNKVSVDLTPVAGFAFGNTDGFITGYEGEISWWNLGLYSEGEYLFDFTDQSDNFFYNWSEIYYAPADWIWFGISAQRTKVYQTSLDLQRGAMLAVRINWVTVTGYYFNPFSGEQFGILNLGIVF